MAAEDLSGVTVTGNARCVIARAKRDMPRHGVLDGHDDTSFPTGSAQQADRLMDYCWIHHIFTLHIVLHLASILTHRQHACVQGMHSVRNLLTYRKTQGAE